MAVEHEIEEGEIDAKIQSVLGDYMKDFEGAVSAENLGPKFGVYGSFLQPITPQKLPSPIRISSQKPIRIRIKLGSDKTRCPELTESPVAPFIIEGDRIRCSKCRKRRLLPYGTKPDQLSQSWLCTMLDWLPGMNCCDISEDDTTTALHALYRSLIQTNFQIDVKAHNGREVSVKKRKSDLGESDANAFRKQKKSKVIQTEKKNSSTSKRKGKSRTRDTGIKDSLPTEREHQTNKYGVKHAECGMIRKQVYKKAIGYGKVARAYIAKW